MIRINRQHIPTLLAAALGLAALIVTYVLIADTWSGLRLSSRMTAINDRLAPPVDEVDADKPKEKPHNEDQQDQPDKPEGIKPPEDQKPEDNKPKDEKLDPADQALARIKAKQMFMKPEKPDFRNILGVLGNRVLYPGGISLKVGDQYNGATIKEIGSSWVKVEYKGEIIPLSVYGTMPSTDDKKAEESSEDKTQSTAKDEPEEQATVNDNHTEADVSDEKNAEEPASLPDDTANSSDITINTKFEVK